jgi:aryl-alcohol dehydrogenase-like predicted oxidoreductase
LDNDKPVSSEIRFLHAIQLGVGAMPWGDRLVWQYGRSHGEQEAHEAFLASLAEGISFIDTAEIYGGGSSERLVGKFAEEAGKPVLIATKFFPMPWRLTARTAPAALRASLARLRRDMADLYQIHWPSPLLSVEKMMEGLRMCVEAGLTRTVGVSNFDQSLMLRSYSALARHNIPLASNQVHYSLLNRAVEKNGLLKRCVELGVRLIAYSPLELGLLTGKYGPDNPPPGNRAVRYLHILPKIAPLLKLMTEIGQDHGGKFNAQVALNWVIRKGALPIPGAKNADQALQNAGALGWSLTDEEVEKLDAASDQVLGYRTTAAVPEHA